MITISCNSETADNPPPPPPPQLDGQGAHGYDGCGQEKKWSVFPRGLKHVPSPMQIYVKSEENHLVTKRIKWLVPKVFRGSLYKHL